MKKSTHCTPVKMLKIMDDPYDIKSLKPHNCAFNEVWQRN